MWISTGDHAGTNDSDNRAADKQRFRVCVIPGLTRDLTTTATDVIRKPGTILPRPEPKRNGPRIGTWRIPTCASSRARPGISTRYAPGDPGVRRDDGGVRCPRADGDEGPPGLLRCRRWRAARAQTDEVPIRLCRRRPDASSLRSRRPKRRGNAPVSGPGDLRRRPTRPIAGFVDLDHPDLAVSSGARNRAPVAFGAARVRLSRRAPTNRRHVRFLADHRRALRPGHGSGYPPQSLLRQ